MLSHTLLRPAVLQRVINDVVINDVRANCLRNKENVDAEPVPLFVLTKNQKSEGWPSLELHPSQRCNVI